MREGLSISPEAWLISEFKVAVDVVEERVVHLVCRAPPRCCFLNSLGCPRMGKARQGSLLTEAEAQSHQDVLVSRHEEVRKARASTKLF